MSTEVPIDAYRVAVEVLQRVAASEGTAVERLTHAVDAVVHAVRAELGLVVHAREDAWEVRRIGLGPATAGPARAEPLLRVVPRSDPLLAPVRDGQDAVRTMSREVGPPWTGSPRREEIRRVWGVDQLVTVPVRTGPSFVCVMLGRLGEDFTDDDLAVLSMVQPVLVALNRILDPDSMPDPEARIVHLTTREQVVLDLLARGHTAARIAHQAQISPRTVHHHLANIYGKLGVGDRLSAVNRARSMGLIEAESLHV
ncbi:helix-turn-helix transcriptional regulator [Ornithinimicrobium cerasi]|uniref:Regulatory protein, luxR family n=1 Tax=Ornithinimicrobium cerasi TaxID=2248773 RepID=A0A285VBV4_9MICO|nr:LuxR C-terminal-related transcriptional regulator [Ornithinimicrobium cerasi]SOC51564.1 regulatory protein, luxR family [Ornithinimicrobium cerasi]